MKTEELNIDAELYSLTEIGNIMAKENFQDEIFTKLKSIRRNNINFTTAFLCMLILIINIMSFIVNISNHKNQEKEEKLTTIIRNFSLDK